jgi:hypothetical protein
MTTVTITSVPKNMAVLREKIDGETVLRKGFYRYWERILSWLHH